MLLVVKWAWSCFRVVRIKYNDDEDGDEEDAGDDGGDGEDGEDDDGDDDTYNGS